MSIIMLYIYEGPKTPSAFPRTKCLKGWGRLAPDFSRTEHEDRDEIPRSSIFVILMIPLDT